jgi:hypothetical protein
LLAPEDSVKQLHRVFLPIRKQLISRKQPIKENIMENLNSQDQLLGLDATLLARYSTAPTPPPVFNSFMDVSGVGKHAIVAVWEAGALGERLVDRIVARVRDLGVTEAFVVPVRFGWADTAATNQVTVVIKVKPGMAEREKAQEVAASCHEILAW